MKIIRLTHEGCILQATDDELARIAGFHSSFYAQRGQPGWTRERRPIVGTEVAISPMWDWMAKARDALSRLEGAAEMARGASAVLGLQGYRRIYGAV